QLTARVEYPIAHSRDPAKSFASLTERAEVFLRLSQFPLRRFDLALSGRLVGRPIRFQDARCGPADSLQRECDFRYRGSSAARGTAPTRARPHARPTNTPAATGPSDLATRAKAISATPVLPPQTALQAAPQRARFELMVRGSAARGPTSRSTPCQARAVVLQ